MTAVALVVKLTAKQGSEAEVAQFLAGAVDLASHEPGTTVWFALRTDDRRSGDAGYTDQGAFGVGEVPDHETTR